MLGAKEMRRWGGAGEKTCRPWPSEAARLAGTSQARRTRTNSAPWIRSRTNRPGINDRVIRVWNMRVSRKCSEDQGLLVPKRKIPNSSCELRIAPSFLSPQLKRRAEPRRPAQHHASRSSGSWIILIPAPSQVIFPQWLYAGFVPNYSGGTATASHRLPSMPLTAGPAWVNII